MSNQYTTAPLALTAVFTLLFVGLSIRFCKKQPFTCASIALLIGFISAAVTFAFYLVIGTQPLRNVLLLIAGNESRGLGFAYSAALFSIFWILYGTIRAAIAYILRVYHTCIRKFR